MSTTTKPTIEELRVWAKTRTFSDIERDEQIVLIAFDAERWGYPQSEYYQYDDPVTCEKRSNRVNRFLSRIVASLKG